MMRNIFSAIIVCCFLSFGFSQETITENQKQELITKYNIPEFSSNVVTDFAIEFAFFMNQMEASKEGDRVMQQKMKERSMDLNLKSDKIREKMSEEDKMKFEKFFSEFTP